MNWVVNLPITQSRPMATVKMQLEILKILLHSHLINLLLWNKLQVKSAHCQGKSSSSSRGAINYEDSTPGIETECGKAIKDVESSLVNWNEKRWIETLNNMDDHGRKLWAIQRSLKNTDTVSPFFPGTSTTEDTIGRLVGSAIVKEVGNRESDPSILARLPQEKKLTVSSTEKS